MINKLLENTRLFFKAIRMTLRGERVTRPYGKLIDWIEEAASLSDALLTIADDTGITQAEREKILLKIDGRNQSAQTILAGVHYHANQEFQYMLSNPTEHTITAIYATNMNDRYAVQRLIEADALHDPRVRSALGKLSDHLQAIPPSNALES
jgi:hypothetical protein